MSSDADVVCNDLVPIVANLTWRKNPHTTVYGVKECHFW